MALARHLGESVTRLEGDILREPKRFEAEVKEAERVVWVTPVYAWTLPGVVRRFIRRCRMKCFPKVNHYLVVTCGDDTGWTDAVWADALSHRGWNPRGAWSVTMPNTYVCLKGFDVDSAEVAQAKLAAMPARVEHIASEIARGSSLSDLERGSWAWVKTHIVSHLFAAFLMSPLPFHTTDACTSCGLCARSCPMDNISIAGAEKVAGRPVSGAVAASPGRPQLAPTSHSRPQWGPACAMCLRCYHACPHHAVAYGKSTASKGQKPVRIS